MKTEIKISEKEEGRRSHVVHAQSAPSARFQPAVSLRHRKAKKISELYVVFMLFSLFQGTMFRGTANQENKTLFRNFFRTFFLENIK